MKPIVAIALLCALALAGCGSSPPNRYYVLTPLATGPTDGQTPALGVGPVTTAAYLDRASLVYRLEGNRLQVADTERWAEPLNSGIGRVVSLNLASLLGTGNVRSFPWNIREAPEVAVRLNVMSLEAGEAEARLLAEWQVYRPASGEVGERHLSRLSQALAAGDDNPGKLAATYSELLYRLCQEIAAAIRQLKL